MKALATHNIERQVSRHRQNGRGTALNRLVHGLIHDVIPTLVMFSLVTWGAMIMTEHIYLAKLSRSAVLAKASSSQVLFPKEADVPLNMK